MIGGERGCRETILVPLKEENKEEWNGPVQGVGMFCTLKS